jgi:acyl-CoA thioester hydrolase
MGIVHHAAYVVWLEEGRSQWMRDHGSSYASFEADGVSLAVSELEVRYGQPARYDQLVTVRCRVAEVRSRKVTFRYEIVDAVTGQLLASAVTKHISVDCQGKVTKIPEQWRAFMSQNQSV